MSQSKMEVYRALCERAKEETLAAMAKVPEDKRCVQPIARPASAPASAVVVFVVVSRFVPVGDASLSADAPGWEGDVKSTENSKDAILGPVCWKCKGGHQKR